MIYTFANRNVGLVGKFETAYELMPLAIQYLGGNIFPLFNKLVRPEVIVIGMHTDSKVIKDIEDNFMKGPMAAIIVYEGKIDDHMPDDKLFCDIIERVKKELPWTKHY